MPSYECIQLLAKKGAKPQRGEMEYGRVNPLCHQTGWGRGEAEWKLGGPAAWKSWVRQGLASSDGLEGENEWRKY